MPKIELKPKPKRAVGARILGAKMLGLKVQRADQLVRKVQAGFGFEHLANLEKRSGLTRQFISKFAAIPIRTLSRRQIEGRLDPQESDRILRASRVFELAVNLFEGDVDEARHWLQIPNSALGGAIPLEFASTDVGAREVENVIGRLEYGVFT